MTLSVYYFNAPVEPLTPAAEKDISDDGMTVEKVADKSA
jgi:hypothetical protein